MRCFEHFQEFTKDAGGKRGFVHREIAICDTARDSGERWCEVGSTAYDWETLKRDRPTFSGGRNAFDNPHRGCQIMPCSVADCLKRIRRGLFQQLVDFCSHLAARAAGFARIAEGESPVSVAPLKRW
jgi:hypothetical protein